MPAQAELFELAATDKTPGIRFDPAHGLFEIQGCSIPENAHRFYSPIYDLVERYLTAPAKQTTVRVELSYFNSSSAKYLLDILKRLEDLHASAASQVVLEWHHSRGDQDMAEAGQDYRSLLEFPVKLVELRDRT